MLDIISNPLYVAYLALIVAVLTAVRVFIPADDDSGSAPAPKAAAPAAPTASPVAVAPVASDEDEAVVAAIVAALTLYEGSGFTIRSIRPATGGGNLWVTAGRLENLSN